MNNSQRELEAKSKEENEFLPPFSQFFPRKHPLDGGEFQVTVHGESQINSNGLSRQETIARLELGEVIQLVREPENEFDKNAIRVDCRYGTIGYVAKDEAMYLAPICDEGRVTLCTVHYIGGGSARKPSLGVWLRVELSSPPKNATEIPPKKKRSHKKKPESQA